MSRPVSPDARPCEPGQPFTDASYHQGPLRTDGDGRRWCVNCGHELPPVTGPGPTRVIPSPPRLASQVSEYQSARMACELARNILAAHDLGELLRAIDVADAAGPMFDPSLWMRKQAAMAEDRRVFSAALKFLGAWPKTVTPEAKG